MSDKKDDTVVYTAVSDINYSSYFGNTEVKPLVKIKWHLKSNPDEIYEDEFVIDWVRENNIK